MSYAPSKPWIANVGLDNFGALDDAISEDLNL